MNLAEILFAALYVGNKVAIHTVCELVANSYFYY